MDKLQNIHIFNELGYLPVSKLIVRHSPVGVFGQRGGRTVGSQYGLVWILTSMRLFVIPDSRQCHHRVSRPSVSISTSHHPLSLMSWGFLTAFMAQARVTPSHAANSKKASYSRVMQGKAMDNLAAKVVGRFDNVHTAFSAARKIHFKFLVERYKRCWIE